MVLDDDDGVSLVHEARHRAEQHADVGPVQAGGRLVEHVERVPPAGTAQLRREFHPLRLAARQRRRRLTKAQVAQAEFGQDAEDARGPRVR